MPKLFKALPALVTPLDRTCTSDLASLARHLDDLSSQGTLHASANC